MPLISMNNHTPFFLLKRFAQSHKMLALLVLSTVSGAVIGIFFPKQMLLMRFIDNIFMNILKLIAMPLIFFSIVSAIISINNVKSFKSIWIYTTFYMLINVSIAVIIGLFLSNLFEPGFGMSSNHILLKSLSTQRESSEISSVILNLFPPDIFTAIAKFEILPIVIFSIIFGLALTKVGKSATPVILFFLGMRNVFNKIVGWLLYLTPIGLFSLLGSAMAEAFTKETLMRSIGGLSLFITIFLLGLLIQVAWQIAIVKFLIQRNPKDFIIKSSGALMMGFATSSSLSTLPITLLAARDHKIRSEIANFVLPFTATLNMASTAMYEAVAALFFCQILGIHLSLYSQLGIFLTAIIAGMGAAGIPEGGLLTMVLVLRSANIPVSAIAMLLPFDRFLDRLRTVVNIWSDLVCAAMVNDLIYRPKNKKTGYLFRTMDLLTPAKIKS